jgi:hypothetical protein
MYKSISPGVTSISTFEIKLAQLTQGISLEISSRAETLGSLVRTLLNACMSVRVSCDFVLPCVGSGLAI